jgi:hypothetical protein
MSDQLTFLSAEPPASRSPSPGSEAAWMTTVATWPSSFVALLAELAPAGSFGRMSPVCSPLTEGELSPPSSEGWQNAGMVSPTECWTLSLSEWTDLPEQFPSDEGVSSLSDVLETGDVPQRYYLSPRACAGILRRAEKRGKSLPPQLRRALKAVAGSEPISIVTGD